MDSEAPYSALSPETVLDAIEAVGHRCDGRVLALNSYENRVYQIGIEDDAPVVAKFYRPGRWSDEGRFRLCAPQQALSKQPSRRSTERCMRSH